MATIVRHQEREATHKSDTPWRVAVVSEVLVFGAFALLLLFFPQPIATVVGLLPGNPSLLTAPVVLGFVGLWAIFAVRTILVLRKTH